MLVRGELPAFRDHLDYFVPLREATAAALRAGELPIWNAWSGSGEPWLANPQTNAFYPPSWVVALLPFHAGYVLFIVVHLVLGGLGAQRLFARWARDDVATLAACAMMLSGAMLSLGDVSNVLVSLAWVPWILALALEGRRDSAMRDGGALALCFLGGEPLVALLCAGLYTATRVAREARPALLPVAKTGVFAVLFSAVQLLPFLAALAASERARGLDASLALSQSMPPSDWLRIALSPQAPGAPGVSLVSQSFLPSIYLVPLLALVPVCLPLLWRKEGFPRRACVGWLLLALGCGFLAAGSSTGLSERAYLLLGLAVNRYPVKLALPAFFALGALGAICLDRLLDASRAESGRAVAAVALAATLPLLLAFGPGAHAALLLAAWVALIAIVLVAKLPRDWAILILLVAVCVDAIASSRFLFVSRPLSGAVMPYGTLLDRERKVVRLEQLDRRRDPAAARASREEWLGGYLNVRNRQFDVMTAAPLVDRRYLDLVDYAISRPRIDILDFLGAGYLLTTRSIDVPGFRQIGAAGDVRIYERAAALPLSTVWERYAIAPDRDAALASMSSETWSAMERIEVTGDVAPARADARAGAVSEGRLLETTWRSMRVEVDSPRGGIAVLTQRFAPGWSVSVDGAAATPVVVDGLFRGVAVTPGRHVIDWRYAPRSLALGALLTLAGIAAAIVARWRRAPRLR